MLPVKIMLPTGSLFIPLKVAPARIENNFKGYLIEKQPKLNNANKSVIKKPPNSVAAKIKYFTVFSPFKWHFACWPMMARLKW